MKSDAPAPAADMKKDEMKKEGPMGLPAGTVTTPGGPGSDAGAAGKGPSDKK